MKNQKRTSILWIAQAALQHCLLRVSDAAKNQVNTFYNPILPLSDSKSIHRGFPRYCNFMKGSEGQEET